MRLQFPLQHAHMKCTYNTRTKCMVHVYISCKCIACVTCNVQSISMSSCKCMYMRVHCMSRMQCTYMKCTFMHFVTRRYFVRVVSAFHVYVSHNFSKPRETRAGSETKKILGNKYWDIGIMFYVARSELHEVHYNTECISCKCIACHAM